MPEPKLSLRAAALLNVAKAAASRGMSANSALRELQSLQQGVRRQDFLDAYRYAKDAGAVNQPLRYVRPEYRPNPDRIAPALHPAYMKNNYSYTVKVTAQYFDSGTDVDTFVNVSSEISLTREEIEDIATDIMETGEGEKYAGATIGRVQLVEAVHRVL